MPVAKSRIAQHQAVRRGRASGARLYRPASGHKFKPTVPDTTCDEPTFLPRTSRLAGRGLFRPDPGTPDHLAPLLDFVGDELSKVCGGTCKHRSSQIG